MDSKIILVADDDADTRIIVGSAITSIGHTFIEAKDGTEAVQLCEKGLPDLAILDVMMPGIYGTEVCRVIKQAQGGEHVPVLMLTARDSVKDKVDALDGGADDYLTKPFHFQELQARVKALLRVRDLNLHLVSKNEELHRMQEMLIEKERELLVNQLAGTAAHQLGQPLSAIMLNCHLIESLPASDPRYKAALEAVKQDTKRMAALIEKLKSLDPKNKETYYQGTEILGLGEGKDKP